MATGPELGLERLRARKQSLGSDDGGSNDEFVSKLQRDREEFKRDHPLPPLPSGAAGGASKRSRVAPPASPGRPPTDTPAQSPPYHELLVESSDGDVQSYPVVDPALPLRETLLYHELTPGLHLRLDGDRLDASKSVSDLGLARRAVLQAFAPQVGGGYEDDGASEVAMEVERDEMEAEREMEAEQQHRPPRRRRPVESEGEDGAAGEEGSGEATTRRRRQRVLQAESGDEEPSAGEAEGRGGQQEGVVGGVAMGGANDDGDVPMAAMTSFECDLCALKKSMASAVQVDGCNHPDALVCGSCMVTEVCANNAACPHCRAPASALVQVTTGRRYEVTDTKLSRVDTQGGALAAPDDDDACHTCHKFGFILMCDECEQNRCFKCSGLDWPPEESDPFSCETCARACAEEAEEEEAEEEEEEVDEEEVDEEGDVWEEEEADERAGGREARGDAGGGGAQPAAPADEQQARQTNAQEASARAAKFQEQQRGRVSAPAIAGSGMQHWSGVSVDVAQLDEAKVRCESGLGI